MRSTHFEETGHGDSSARVKVGKTSAQASGKRQKTSPRAALKRKAK